MLIRPLITEKTVRETALGRFAFQVSLSTTKTEVRREVEKTFGVNVTKVQTAIFAGKSYRTGKKWKFLQRPDWKKAIVTLKKGQKIDLFDIQETTKN